MQFFFYKKNQNILDFFLKCLNNSRIFIYMQEKKIFFLLFLGFVWQKLIFLCNKTTKNMLKWCLLSTPLNSKTL